MPDAGSKIQDGICIQYPVSGIWYLASGIWYPVSGIRHLASGIRYLASGIWHLVSGIPLLLTACKRHPPLTYTSVNTMIMA